MALAYRAARQAGLGHHAAIKAADAAYLEERPEAAADRLAMSARVHEMIASAINVDPAWFWRGVSS